MEVSFLYFSNVYNELSIYLGARESHGQLERLSVLVSRLQLHFERCTVGSYKSNVAADCSGFNERPKSLCPLRIRPFDLTRRCDLDLRLSFAQTDCAGDANNFSLQSGDPLVGRQF